MRKIQDNATNGKSTDVDPIVSRLTEIFTGIRSQKAQSKALTDLRDEDAQTVLNALQWLLDYPSMDGAEKSGFLYLLLRLSQKSSLYPQCLVLRDMIKKDEHAVAAGHFGEIWKGQFRGQSVCLKVVKLYQRSHVEHLLKAFAREAILWSQLSHRNLLPFYGIYHLDDGHNRICLVSPWMENGTVREYVIRHPEVRRLPLVSDIVAGILYLHDQGIIHGDLKGQNILISKSGRAYLADFGLSNLVDAELLKWTTSASSAHHGGTVRWQAPELFDPDNEEAKTTKESDIYSFACVCYEVFTSHIPFHELSRESTVIANVMAGKRPSRPDASSTAFRSWGLTSTIWSLLERCWARDPSKRPTIHTILSEEHFNAEDARPDPGGEMFSSSQFRSAVYANLQKGSKKLSRWLDWF